MGRMICPTELLLAAEAIRAGRLVAFPTETVYGLGANALDPIAVARIYAAKRRPLDSPLIVHVASEEEAIALASDWPSAARKLAARFWPGPLTLVVRKRPIIPDIVTAGLPTVGIRVPAHDIALELIRAADRPIAAPSANRFTELSPTRAEHVRKSLGENVSVVLDGGITTVGIESTVIDLSGARPRLLRPGTIHRAELESVVGPISTATQPEPNEKHLSPGQHLRHYQPRSPLILAPVHRIPVSGNGAFVAHSQFSATTRTIGMPADPLHYAAQLYDVLHRLDADELDWIAVEPPPAGTAWDGIRDRLVRASS